MTVLPDRRIVIPALGITQIFVGGSTFYLPAALAPLIARDTGWAYDLTVGGVSIGMLVAGLASPRVGRLIADGLSRPGCHCRLDDDFGVSDHCTGHCSLRRRKRDPFGCQGNGAAGAIRR